MEELLTYFPELSAQQREQFAQLPTLYSEWNAQINVVSRKDIENLLERHVLHSLAIAKVQAFDEGSKILDLGTGGGFPGIPLAILFPETQFVMVDGRGKKIKVVQEVAHALGLENVEAIHGRAEELKRFRQFDFVVTRAVASLDKLLLWSQKLISQKHQHAIPNGILALKGGNLQSEIKALPGKGKEYTDLYKIQEFFPLPYFEEKYVVYVQA